MKKYILGLLSLVLLSGCQLFSSDQPANDVPVESSSALLETETDHVSVTEASEVNNSLFNEEIVGQSDYPVSTSPENINPAELMPAVEEYYSTSFSQDEQFANAPQVTEGAMNNIANNINANEALAQLDVTVDQISLQLNGKTIYVPRIVVPMTYSQSIALVVENDVALFNSAITEVGNRLVMIAYYDADNDSLTPMHLMNLSHSLFYYEATH